MKTLSTQQHSGTLHEFIGERLKLDQNNQEQTQAFVRELFYLVAEVVCDSGFSDQSIRSFPVLKPDLSPESCVNWLIRLILWSSLLLPWEQAVLGKARVIWE